MIGYFASTYQSRHGTYEINFGNGFVFSLLFKPVRTVKYKLCYVACDQNKVVIEVSSNEITVSNEKGYVCVIGRSYYQNRDLNK